MEIVMDRDSSSVPLSAADTLAISPIGDETATREIMRTHIPHIPQKLEFCGACGQAGHRASDSCCPYRMAYLL